jgi:hypothetical protein
MSRCNHHVKKQQQKQKKQKQQQHAMTTILILNVYKYEVLNIFIVNCLTQCFVDLMFEKKNEKLIAQLRLLNPGTGVYFHLLNRNDFFAS